MVPPGDVQPCAGQVVSCLFRGERGSLIGLRSIHKIRHACTNRNTHQLKDYNRADPAMKTPVSVAAIVCVCLWWGTSGIRAHAEHLEC